MPDGAVYVGRPTKWGNPYRLGEMYPPGDPIELQWHARREDVVDQFTDYAYGFYIDKPPSFEPLRGKDLVCWCRLDQPCHADVLLEIANEESA